jgi:uncharacterized OB-fold protein
MDRPVPVIDDTTRAFWTAGRDGQLCITQCAPCQRLFHPPAPICPYCSSRDVAPTAVDGRGQVDAFTVVQRPWVPGYDTPYVVARVRLIEDPTVLLLSNVVGCAPSDVRVGMDVTVAFEQRDDVFLPVFEPTP